MLLKLFTILVKLVLVPFSLYRIPMSTYDVTFETLNDVYSIHSGHESFIIPKDFSTPLTIKGTL